MPDAIRVVKSQTAFQLGWFCETKTILTSGLSRLCPNHQDIAHLYLVTFILIDADNVWYTTAGTVQRASVENVEDGSLVILAQDSACFKRPDVRMQEESRQRALRISTLEFLCIQRSMLSWPLSARCASSSFSSWSSPFLAVQVHRQGISDETLGTHQVPARAPAISLSVVSLVYELCSEHDGVPNLLLCVSDSAPTLKSVRLEPQPSQPFRHLSGTIAHGWGFRI
ncbi:hypothetical protein J3F84DRAFT_358514 [Trichoderma pleuroticola]